MIPQTIIMAPESLMKLIFSWKRRNEAIKMITKVRAINGYTYERSARDNAINQNTVDNP